MARHNRQRAWTRGRRAETFAAWWLRLKGYRVLARNFRVAPGEIDLIARRHLFIFHIKVLIEKFSTR